MIELNRTFLGRLSEQLSELIEQQSAEVFKRAGIIIPVKSSSLMGAIGTLGPISVADLVRALDRSHQLIQQKMPKLLALGLVSRRPDPADQRVARRRGNALEPGDDVPEHRPDQCARLCAGANRRRCAGRSLGPRTFPPKDLCMTITIFHNPACGTSRNTLAMIRNSGVEPTVIEYLTTPPTKARLQELLAAMGTGPRPLLREKGTPYTELDLANEKWTDDELLDFMLAHPILINRPVVETPLGTRLCRPSELVLDILPAPQKGAFTKEDGEVVIDAKGRRA